MTTYSVASLSEQGWLSDPRSVLNYVFTCYMLSDAAQSLAFQNNITSLSQTYYAYINDPEAMASGMQRDLQTLLSRYFAQVDVYARAKEVSGKNYAILLQAQVVTPEGERCELSKVMQLDTHKLRKIIDINNYGDGDAVFESV